MDGSTPNNQNTQNSNRQNQPIDLNNTQNKLKKIKAIKTLGIVCLILGIISTLLWLPIGPWSPFGYDIAGWILAMIYEMVSIVISTICLILLIICIVKKVHNHLKEKGILLIPILGFVLSLSFWIFLAIYTAINTITHQIDLAHDPFLISAGNMSTSNCYSSTVRADNENWSDPNSLGSNPEYVAEDIGCAYLEHFYDHGKEPTSETQVLQYTQSYDAKNHIASITINSNQPEFPNIYNIITHRSCSHDDTNNDSSISIWFRDASENNGIGCTDISADIFENGKTNYLNMYDLDDTNSWYSENFNDEDFYGNKH